MLREARRFINPDDFAVGRERDVVTFTLAHFDQHGVPPDQFVFQERAGDLGLDDDEVEELIGEYFDDPGQTEFVKSTIIEFARTRRLAAALEEAAGMLGVEDWNAVTSVLRAAEIYGEVSDRDIAVLPFDRDVMHQFTNLRRVATGISNIDEDLGGGLPVGHLGCVMAPPNHGKSSFLINLGAEAIKRRISVVHFSFEMSVSQIAQRYNACLGGLDIFEVSGVKRKKNGPKKKSGVIRKAQLVIIGRPAGSLTPAGLREDVRTVIQDRRIQPGLILIDYPALMRSSRQYNEKRHELADIFRDLYAFSRSTQVPIWGAHQTNRGGMESDRSARRVITMSDSSECFEIAQIVDVMVTLNMTDGERSDGLMRLHVAKNRIGPANATYPVNADLKNCRFFDQYAEDDDD